MMCGSKCFMVKMELNGEQVTEKVKARTPINARKVIRREYGPQTKIISVRAEERNK